MKLHIVPLMDQLPVTEHKTTSCSREGSIRLTIGTTPQKTLMLDLDREQLLQNQIDWMMENTDVTTMLLSSIPNPGGWRY